MQSSIIIAAAVAQSVRFFALARELEADGPKGELEQEICRCIGELARTLKPESMPTLRRESVELDGIAVKDFAARRGISASNAGVRVFRAREALRRQVAAACGTCAEHGCFDCHCASEER